jgi:hypothetical protein
MHDQPRSPSMTEKALNMLGLFALAAQVLAVSVEPILHKRMGKHALGMPAFFATLAIPFWGVLFPSDNLVPLFRFWLVFIAGCALNRIFPAPPGTHTAYGGTPRLAFIFRWMDETKLKGVLEPLLVFVAGIAFYPMSHALGTYLMLASFGLAAVMSLSEAVLRAKVDQLNDARIEQEHLAHEFRRLRGE